MASRPDEPPESIVLSQFSGIRNTVDRERLGLTDLEVARNVDFDSVGQPRRRRGYELKIAGDFHSIRTIGGRVLGVKDGELGEIVSGPAFDGLGYTIGQKPLSYAQVGDVTYFASEIASGKLQGDLVSQWGLSNDAGQWVSPVVLETATLGKVSGRTLRAPPLASLIAYYRGRIYLASGRYLWATELYLYDHVERERNFIQFEHDITMIAPVDDGIYLGTTDAVYFLSGSFGQGMPRQKLMDTGAVRGSSVEVPTSEQASAGQALPEAMGVMFLTSSGVCVGAPGGQLVNRTRSRVVFPGITDAAALYREDQGATSYVAVTNSGGGPAANARIGDFVDAEIVRAVKRG